jgi:hypothetical protein
MDNNLFRKSSIDRISSPEQLNDYIRVTNPSIWVILAAIIILLASIIIWGAFGNLPTEITTSGVAKDGKIVRYLSESDAAKVKSKMPVKIDRVGGTITSVSDLPMSFEEISPKYSDYTIYSFNLSQWNYEVVIQADGIADGIVPVSIVTESIKPIFFLLN